ncbi:membrane protein [Corynebacterium frankenforstense DSM 45800]|uniref:Membrane protein n=1 Tax=Corynebacterium frankenforstense DSM 45800 TaxID=1437875 RepID=A0A1L7CRH4_9CORY|nr:DUF3152 domain-containing protein [Corynebacterium frankenforstense]APT88432.1 membrane protein [Corynebacterium frankenforstense DSM 45800]
MSHEPWYVRFARSFGWRAYAIPVLAVITVWVLIDVFTGSGMPNSDETPDQAAESSTLETGPNPADQPDPHIAADELPAGGPYATESTGEYRLIGKPGAEAGQGTEKTVRYVIEVEKGVDTSSTGGDDALAHMIDATLTNPAGWTHDERFRFEHVGPDDDPNMRIQLTSVGTTHETCGHDLAMETSCFYSDGNRLVINEARWVRGATPFKGDIGSYRQYLINHEVGHGIGFAAHQPCGGDGELAPVMMQQTLSLNNAELHSFDPEEVYPDVDETCRYNPWPYPKVQP